MGYHYWTVQDKWDTIDHDLVVLGRKAMLEFGGKSAVEFELVNPKTGELLLHIKGGQIVWLDSDFAILMYHLGC